MFVDAGFHVIRFDNRDVGLSTHFSDASTDEHGAAYRVLDMANDAVAVLDAAGVERAHAMGLSMGGMIVQQLAIHHRDRLLSIVSVMSRTGETEFGQSTPEALSQLTGAPATDRESAIERHVEGQRIWGSPEYADESRWRADAARAFDRCFDPAGVGRQFFAVGASGSWADDLPNVTTRALVMHGTADTLIDISGGRRTAELIPGATFVEIDGMGHDYPPELWERWVAEVASFCPRRQLSQPAPAAARKAPTRSVQRARPAGVVASVSSACGISSWSRAPVWTGCPGSPVHARISVGTASASIAASGRQVCRRRAAEHCRRPVRRAWNGAVPESAPSTVDPRRTGSGDGAAAAPASSASCRPPSTRPAITS